MFRPEPAYLVSSLCFSRLSCRVGSSVGTATRAFLAGLVAPRRCERREAGGSVAGACVVLADNYDGQPCQYKRRDHLGSTIRSDFQLRTSPQISFEFHLQFDWTILFAAQGHAVYIKEHLVPLQGIDKSY